MLVTGGGAQSNHARQTAAAAARLGLDAHVVLGGATEREIAAPAGNMLLDLLLGATIERVSADRTTTASSARSSTPRTRLRGARDGDRTRSPSAARRRPESRPTPMPHASCAPSAPDVDVVFVADGSGGTHAGLLAGAGGPGPHPRRRSRRRHPTEPRRGSRAPRRSSRRARDRPRPRRAGLRRRRRRGRWTRCASRLAPKGYCSIPCTPRRRWPRSSHGAREGRLTTAASVCFWHTGGQPALFAPKCMGPL